VPPAVGSLKLVVDPAQTTAVPVIGAGNGLTVTVVVIRQPVGNVYVIVAVPKADPPTTPLDMLTGAIADALLLQVPPVLASLSVEVKPRQTLVLPEIGAGNGFTVTET